MSYERTQSQSSGGRGSRDAGADDSRISAELEQQIFRAAADGPAGAKRFIDAFPPDMQAGAWALLHKHPRFGTAFVAEAVGQAPVKPGELDPGVMGAWRAAAERGVDEAKDFYVRAIKYEERAKYEAAFKERWGEEYVEIKLGRTTQEAIDRRKRIDARLASQKAAEAGDSMFGPAAEVTGPAAEVTPAEAEKAPAPTATPEQRRECLDDLDYLGDLHGKIDFHDRLSYYRFEAAAQRVQKWRAVFPAALDDASAKTYPVGNPHKMLKQWERICENAARKFADAKGRGEVL